MIQYKQLASEVMSDIDTGKISPGHKLQSVRDFSRQHQVSMTTALNCYHLLIERGYAHSRPRSGYFAQKPMLDIARVPLADFVPVTSRGAKYHFAVSQHPLATAQLSQALLPQAELAKSASRVFKTPRLHQLHYGAVTGHESLRRALAGHYSEQGFKFTSDEIIIGHGCLDSVRMALQVTTQPEDTVVVASPCFPGLLSILKSLNRKILEIPSSNQGIDLLRLESIVKEGRASALLLTANFQNPLGHQFNNEHKAAIAELANRYHFPVIEDDVYQELCFSGGLPLPIKHWDKGGYVLWCSSFSKTLCASYRIGWCLPGRFHRAMEDKRRIESLGVNMPLQLVLADFIASGNYRKHIKKLQVCVSQQIREYRHFLYTQLGANAAFSQPEGGMVLWCHYPGLDSFELAKKLTEYDVIIRPGGLFSTRDFYSEYFRLNCGWPLDEKRKQEMELLCQLLTQQKQNETNV
ncbi:PLP-dependent aminotransferase family protein [Planctobacterium marinum]|uniref:GntR family transcriptional regulator n=1 Tax=Planctobacterium marinum TaxID=1631968 RepID=A0AA48KR37_9ALTE|nr:GntR family transcriptional regulator [Planctobacterium marinum]